MTDTIGNAIGDTIGEILHCIDFMSIFYCVKLVMSRSIWKGPFSLLKNENRGLLSPQEKKQNKIISVWSRNSMVLPEHIGNEFQIYNGKSCSLRKVMEEMVGHKFGEFCPTKKKTVHKVNKTKQITRKKQMK